MRLEELPQVPGQFFDVRPAVRMQLASAGLTDIAVYRTFGEGREQTVFVATGAGIYIGSWKAQENQRGEVALAGELMPWTEVRGARMFWAGFPHAADGFSLTVKIDRPDFDETERHRGEQSALAEFGMECMKRQLGWALDPERGP